MEEERKRFCQQVCLDAYKMKSDGKIKYYKDMAEYVKKRLDEEAGGSWHVIVGTHFGSFFSYEIATVLQFWLEHIGFLIFKHG